MPELPSIHEGWRFNFDKKFSKLKNSTAYVLITEKTPHIIEGCLIFQLTDKKRPYMPYIEIAPHNKIETKKYDHVAGCLIAYAFKLSIIYGVGIDNGILEFDVLEEKKEDEIKLMALYSEKYNAARINNSTTMVIYDKAGEALIERYLQ